MDLKKYQRRVVDEVDLFLRTVAEERAKGNALYASLAAWDSLRRPLALKGEYKRHQNGLGEDLPTVTVKVPTGGGKTLIATQALGSIHRTLLADRNGAGLVLWVVPSSQIYRDTLRRLSDRNDLYRLMLEHAVSRRIEVWEKHELHRLSPARLRDNLNILVVQLASTNRETRDQLKFFRDSGGNIVQHFPPEDDGEAHRTLKEQVPNLDMLAEDAGTGQYLVATSVGNLVKLCKPAVILDEGHKATSRLARETIEGFNASAVIELSATPHAGANVITRVSGAELLEEEMIKLPMNVATSGRQSWEDLVTRARDRRESLANKADQWAGANGNPEQRIRPIILVQVERTGRDQRDAGLIHSEQVKEYLMQRLGVPENAIAIKSSERDDIEGLDLLADGCPIEWIITKSALQEGWDCPFAYILVSLNNTTSTQGMTQLVGRVLRQPFQMRTPYSDLNESYVYCRNPSTVEVTRQIKTALEREGYEGDATGQIVVEGDPKSRPTRTARIREEIRQQYGKPFEGKIYLPRFCIRTDGGYEALDYFRHLLARVDISAFDYGKISEWRLNDELKKAKDRYYRITLGQDLEGSREEDIDTFEQDESVLAWLVANLSFEYLSQKQLRVIVRSVYERLCATDLFLDQGDRIALVKFPLREKISAFIEEEIDIQTEQAFIDLFQSETLRFYLECSECRFEIPQNITIKAKGENLRPLLHADAAGVQRSLFDYVDEEHFNDYEKAVALCLDRNEKVLWWYRNLAARGDFDIQGYRRHRVRPDFVVQDESSGRPRHHVLVIETKGEQLEGNRDTEYKRRVAGYFEKVGRQVTWQQLGEDFKDHMFRFQILDETQAASGGWQDRLYELLANPESV